MLRKLALCIALLAGTAAHAQDEQQAAAEPAIPPGAQALVEHFGMAGIPHEGAWFIQTHKSDELIEGALAERYDGPRYAYTAIYAIFTVADFSAMHRLKTDEIWHFYGGTPSQILMLYPDGSGETKIWGPDVLAGQEPQILVPAGTWMGARPIGDPATAYSFGGNTLSPGFEYADYEPGYRDELIAAYPDFAKEITRLTREDSLTRPAGSPPPAAPAEPIAVDEYVGREGPQVSDKISMARFTLQPGTAMPLMATTEGHEVMVVTAGKGTVLVGDAEQQVARGSVVYLPPEIPHRITAETRLEFYVSAAPAWQQSDVTIIEP